MDATRLETLRQRYNAARAKLLSRRRWSATPILIVRWYAWLQRQHLKVLPEV